MIQLDFKTDRIRKEFESGNLNLKLVKIFKMSLEWLYINYPEYKKVVITDIFRTVEEQDELYKNSSKYQKKPFLSVHQFWRGLDIRTNDMPNHISKNLTSFLNMFIYDKKRQHKKTAKLHDIGNGSHIHIQVMV